MSVLAAGRPHKCEPPQQQSVQALVGAGVGAMIGFVGLTVYYGVTTGSAQSGLVGVFMGGQVGAMVGAIIGWRVRRIVGRTMTA